MRGSADGRAVGQACPPAFPSANSRSAFKKGFLKGKLTSFALQLLLWKGKILSKIFSLVFFLHFAIFQGCSFGPRWGHFGVRLEGVTLVSFGARTGAILELPGEEARCGIACVSSLASLWCYVLGPRFVHVGVASGGPLEFPGCSPNPKALGSLPRALGEPPPTRLWGAFPELRGASPRHSWASIDPQKGHQHLNSDPRKGTQHLNSDPRRAIRA